MTKEFCKPVFYRDVLDAVAGILTILVIIFAPLHVGKYLLQDEEDMMFWCEISYSDSWSCGGYGEWIMGFTALLFLSAFVYAGFWLIITAYKRWWIPPEECK